MDTTTADNYIYAPMLFAYMSDDSGKQYNYVAIPVVYKSTTVERRGMFVIAVFCNGEQLPCTPYFVAQDDAKYTSHSYERPNPYHTKLKWSSKRFVAFLKS